MNQFIKERLLAYNYIRLSKSHWEEQNLNIEILTFTERQIIAIDVMKLL